MTTLSQRLFDLVESTNRLLIINLSNKKLSRKIALKEWNRIVHWSWLSDDVFVIFNEHYNGLFTQYIYYCDFSKPESEPRLINERPYDFLRVYDEVIDDLSKILINACKMTINKHDFMFVKSSEMLLFPCDTAESKPQLPPFKINLRNQNVKVAGKPHWSDTDLVFAYKNVLYFCVRGGNKRWHMDRFIRVPLDDFDANTRKIVFHPEAIRNNLFEPEQVSDGWFRTEFSEGLKIWQDGHMVLFYNMYPKKDRIIWILDLEKGTIMEKTMKTKFTSATLFQGHLQLWFSNLHKTENTREMVTKFLFLNDHEPKLSNICTAKVLSPRK